MRSPYRAALVLLAAGGALAFFAYGQTWVFLTAHVSGLPATSRTVSGRELEPGAGVLPLLLLAAVLAVWATSGWLRRAIGVLAMVAAVVVLVAAVRSSPPLLSTDVPVRFELVGVPTYSVTGWWLLGAVGGLLGLAGGALVAWFGDRWPGLSDRYRRDPAATAVAAGRSPSGRRGTCSTRGRTRPARRRIPWLLARPGRPLAQCRQDRGSPARRPPIRPDHPRRTPDEPRASRRAARRPRLDARRLDGRDHHDGRGAHRRDRRRHRELAAVLVGGVALVVVGAIVGKVMQLMGYGATSRPSTPDAPRRPNTAAAGDAGSYARSVTTGTDLRDARRARRGARSGWRPYAGPLLVAGGVLAATAYVAFVDPNQPGHFPLCPFKEITGLDCPGCGGLRAVHALTHGDLGTALDQNLLVTVLVLPLAVAAWVAWVLRCRPGRAAAPRLASSGRVRLPPRRDERLPRLRCGGGGRRTPSSC